MMRSRKSLTISLLDSQEQTFILSFESISLNKLVYVYLKVLIRQLNAWDY